MIPDDHKRVHLRRSAHRVCALPTEPGPLHPSLIDQPEPEPWTRAAPARPVPVSRPWWRRLIDWLLSR